MNRYDKSRLRGGLLDLDSVVPKDGVSAGDNVAPQGIVHTHRGTARRLAGQKSVLALPEPPLGDASPPEGERVPMTTTTHKRLDT